jgi:NAD(P)-dependent dehydrogenase (short-subunit alcohol dehydrogenase family)
MSEPSAGVAFVTGASRGIGRQLCVDLAADGFDVVCAARSSEDRPGKLPGTVEATAAAVEAAGRRALPLALDVRDPLAVGDAVEEVYSQFGRCDLLVNNAAVAPVGRVLDLSLKRWALAVDVNLNGPLFLSWHVAERMRAAEGGGRIVNVSSVASEQPGSGRTSYTVTKAALEVLTRCLAVEWAPAIAVNCLQLEIGVWSEGRLETGASEDDDEEFEDPVVVSDAVRHLAHAPLTLTGVVTTIGALRDQGVVRPPTPHR